MMMKPVKRQQTVAFFLSGTERHGEGLSRVNVPLKPEPTSAPARAAAFVETDVVFPRRGSQPDRRRSILRSLPKVYESAAPSPPGRRVIRRVSFEPNLLRNLERIARSAPHMDRDDSQSEDSDDSENSVSGADTPVDVARPSSQLRRGSGSERHALSVRVKSKVSFGNLGGSPSLLRAAPSPPAENRGLDRQRKPAVLGDRPPLLRTASSRVDEEEPQRDEDRQRNLSTLEDDVESVDFLQPKNNSEDESSQPNIEPPDVVRHPKIGDIQQSSSARSARLLYGPPPPPYARQGGHTASKRAGPLERRKEMLRKQSLKRTSTWKVRTHMTT